MSDHSHSDSHKAKVEIPEGIYRRGFMTFLALAVLTAIEFFVGAVENPSTVLLILLAIAKAALVMNVFMGVTKLWRGGDHH